MRHRLKIGLSVLTILLWGCGKGETVNEIRQLRAEGNQDQAREVALAELEVTPSNFKLWLEYANVEIELTRKSERADGEHTWKHMVEASLVCGAVYKYKEQKPGSEWRNACRLAAAEVSKHANKIHTSMSAQASSAEYLSQLLEMDRGSTGQHGARSSAAAIVEEYKANARTLLFQSVLVGRLLEMLPEVSSGSTTHLLSQVETARDNWKRSLELPPELIIPIEERANRTIELAFDRVMGDLQTLGYIIPATITENGVVE